MAKKIPPLILENLDSNENHAYLTLIIYKKQKYLVVVDNIVNEEISAFVLDFAESEDIDVNWFLSTCNLWFYSASEKYPLSFEFAKMGQLDKVKKIIKTFNINSVSRIVGRIFMFNIQNKPKVKRRKIVPVPEYVEIKFKKSETVS
jgi:hypothetical protein